MSSAARRRIARRSGHGVLAQAGCAARAAATASSTSAAVALRERPEHDVRVDRRADLERTVAVAPGAVHEFWWWPPSPARTASDRVLEAGVELLVVGAERRVRDLDPRLLVGGHWVPRCRCGRDAPGSEGCGQSSAATTSASDAAMASGRRSRPSTRSADVARRDLAGQHEDPAQTDPLGGRARRRRGRHRPSPPIRRGPGAQDPRAARRAPGGRRPATACRGPSPCRRSRTRARRPRRRHRASLLAASATRDCGASRGTSAPPRIRRKAVSRLRYERSSPPSPMTTAATSAEPASASSRVSRCWPSNSRRASGAARTNRGRPGKLASV